MNTEKNLNFEALTNDMVSENLAYCINWCAEAFDVSIYEFMRDRFTEKWPVWFYDMSNREQLSEYCYLIICDSLLHDAHFYNCLQGLLDIDAAYTENWFNVNPYI